MDIPRYLMSNEYGCEKWPIVPAISFGPSHYTALFCTGLVLRPFLVNEFSFVRIVPLRSLGDRWLLLVFSSPSPQKIKHRLNCWDASSFRNDPAGRALAANFTIAFTTYQLTPAYGQLVRMPF
jgi:hypothetical protein